MPALFVSDLDGTLLTREETVSCYSRERLNRLLDDGMIFTYATARSARSAQRAVEGLHLHTPAILYNGGIIYDFDRDETLRYSVFGDDEKRYVLSVLFEYGIVPIVFSAVPGRERVAWLAGNETEGVKRYLARRQTDDRLVPVYNAQSLIEGTVLYFKCVGPCEVLARAWDILKFDSRFICIFHQETYQNDFWMEISPREATKANGVRFLKEHLGCALAVCFGDTSNDSDMFDACEEKYAVMNADSWLKEKATGVIGYCEEDGVAKWLEANYRRYDQKNR